MDRVIKYKGENGTGVYFTNVKSLDADVQKVIMESNAEDIKVLSVNQYLKNFFLAAEANSRVKE
jgi:hypothetical protein